MTLETSLTWLLAFLLVAVGLAGVLIPALPGTILVFAGLALGAWVDGFAHVSLGTVGGFALLTVFSYAIELGAGVLGARKFGASRQAVLGAVLGEYSHRRDLEQASRVGFGTWIGFALGLAAKIAITFTMIGIFVAAYFF